MSQFFTSGGQNIGVSASTSVLPMNIQVYSVPLIYISVFGPVSYCLDDCGFVVEPEVRQVDSSSSILLSQDNLQNGKNNSKLSN